jgi:hypothetical protein
MWRNIHVVLVIILLVPASRILAQSTTSPDISVIPRFRLNSSDNGTGKLETPDFRLEEFEVAIQAYLNPFARADVFLTKAGVADEPVEIEEGYATFVRGLPWGLNARIGKFKAEFGKINMMHPHAWPFVTTPLSVQRFTGDEGVNDLGAGASILIPTGDEVYSRLAVELVRGSFAQTLDATGGASSGGIGMRDSLGQTPPYALSGRLMTFLPVSDESDMEIGLSGLTGVHDPYHDLRFVYGNLDVKYKWKPDSYTALTLQGEVLVNHRSVVTGPAPSGGVLTGSRTTAGMYAYVDYQFQKMFSVGARYDWAESPYSTNDRAHGYAFFAGFYPVEETTAFRFEYQQYQTQTPAAGAMTVRNVALQFQFSMGPHKAHPF